MNILFIDTGLPMPDRASADLRMFTIVELLAAQGHSCHYLVINYISWSQKLSQAELIRYRDLLERLGIHIHMHHMDKVLLNNQFDIIYFKYFYPAEKTIDHVQLLQPGARIVIDSVDIVYARLFAKAKLENNSDFYVEAEKIKKRELSTYSHSDLVITITPEDTDILLHDLPNINTFIIPNIHEIHAFDSEKTPFPSLIFIGVFTHEPNIDAVLYFYREIWPSIIHAHPDCVWYIVGGNPPQEIQILACSNISVTGYVPETLPYLKKSWISVAPLRFGAGMKGKVGEAMAAGIPVVTTQFGAQGLDVVSGEQLVIAETADDYVKQINNLISDNDKRRHIGEQGLRFIDENYSKKAVNLILNEFITTINKIPTKPSSTRWIIYRLYKLLQLWLNQHIMWRINRA